MPSDRRACEDDRTEFISVPLDERGNRSRGVDDPAIREQDQRVVERLIER